MDYASDNCNTCLRDYLFEPENENFRLYLVLDNPDVHFILAVCPHCGALETIFVPADIAIALVHAGLKLSVMLATPELIAKHERAVGALIDSLEQRDLVAAWADEIAHIEDHLGELDAG